MIELANHTWPSPVSALAGLLAIGGRTTHARQSSGMRAGARRQLVLEASRMLVGAMLGLVLSVASASAQEAHNAARKVEIHVMDGVVRTGGSSLFARCAGVAVAITDTIGVVGESCGTHQYVGDTPVESLSSFRGGVRLRRRVGNRITTFVQGLAGGESAYRQSGHVDDSGFSFDAGGGVDVALMRWLGLRLIQLNYQMTRIDGASVNGMRVGTIGIVVRLGQRSRQPPP